MDTALWGVDIMSTLRHNLRCVLQNRRNSLTAQSIEHCQQLILMTLLAQPEWQTAQYIGVYAAYGREVPTQRLINHLWQMRKHVYLPVVQDDKKLHFAHYQADTRLMVNRYGIDEPANAPLLPAAQLDVVIVPLLGFDRHCQRLGSGMGCYDRTFAFLNNVNRPAQPLLMGLAYALQHWDNLPVADWDVGLNKVITENTLYTRQY